MNDHEIYLISLNLNQDISSQKMYSKDKIVECIGNGMYLPSNQKQIKSPLITSDAVSCCPVTITIININEGATKPKKSRANEDKGRSHERKKNGKKGDIVPFWRFPPPPKRVKRGHLLSDYRQKCVNGTRDILMLKARKMTILAIFGHIVVSKVLIWSIFGLYLAILWCQ